jgi:hypothetical protein
MKGISRGRPASPANSPIAGIQTPPTVVRRCTARSDAEAGHPTLHANSSRTSHKMRLTTGVDNPKRLARARQSELFGACRYFTTPHSQMKGVLRVTIVITAQKSTKRWYFCFPLKVEITFETDDWRNSSEAFGWSAPPKFTRSTGADIVIESFHKKRVLSEMAWFHQL